MKTKPRIRCSTKSEHSLPHEVNKSTRKAKFLFLKNKFITSKNNIKKFWKNINTYLGRGMNNHLPKTMSSQNKELKDVHQIVEGFNKYFSEVASNLLKKIPKSPKTKLKSYLDKIQYNDSSFFFQPTNRYEGLNSSK